MIRSFRHKGLAKFFTTGKTSGIRADHAARLRLILGQLASALSTRDMALPGLRLHPLKGELAGHFAVDVSGNWRVTFRFEGQDVFDVDYVDYHWGEEMSLQMFNPPHPGEIIRELCLKPLGISVTDAAKALGVSRKSLSELLNGKSGVSAEMAIRLSIAFNTSAESWLYQQAQYDLWETKQKRKRLKVRKLAA
jgi:antitoxin HigA-1